MDQHICDYGCGKPAKFQLKSGKWCCERTLHSCKSMREKMSKSTIGKKHQKSERKMILNSDGKILCSHGCGNIATHHFKNGNWSCCEKPQHNCPGSIKNRINSCHNLKPIRLTNNSSILCDYGCGNFAEYQLRNKKYCCSNHVWRCQNLRRNRSIIVSKYFEDKRNTFDPSRKIIDFEHIDSEVKSYLLGFIYADGCIHITKDGTKKFTLQLSKKDKDFLYKISLYFDKTPRYVKCLHKKQNKIYESYRIQTSDRKLCDQLINHGIIPNKTKMDKSSLVFDKIRKDLKKHFIRGFFEGDGCFFRGSRTVRVSITNCNLQLLTSISNEIKSETNINKIYFKSTRPRSVCSDIVISNSNDVRKVCKYLYDNSTIFLERKRNKVLDFLTNTGQIITDSNKLCDYGCGKPARYQLLNGKLCCNKSHNKCTNTGFITGKPGYWAGKKRPPRQKEWSNKIAIANTRNKEIKYLKEVQNHDTTKTCIEVN